MQKAKLPLTVNPIKDAQQHVDYVGYYLRDKLSRLSDSVSSMQSDVEAEISFSIDTQKFIVIQGHARVKVELECQRCNKPFETQLECTFCYSPVSCIDQVKDLPEEYEPIEVDSFGEIELVSVIEDELILALPLISMHDFEHCEVSVEQQIFGEIPEEEKPQNPFVALAVLKKNNI